MFKAMDKMHLLSDRLKWAVKQKEDRESIKITQSALSTIAGTSRASVTNWFQDTTKISAESARPLALYLNVNAVWLETGEGDPASKPGKERIVELLRSDEPLQEMIKQLNYMFIKVEQDDRDLIMGIVNRLYTHNHPNESLATGKKKHSKQSQ